MKTPVIVGTTAAVAVIGAGSLLIPAAGHAPSATTHTLRFTAIAQKQANLSKTTFAQDEVDRNKAGKIIGFDVINGTFNPTTNSATGRVALSTNGGMIYGSLHFSNGPVTTGKVTGGTGKFRGATGTIYGKSLNQAGTRTAVTITWHDWKTAAPNGNSRGVRFDGHSGSAGHPTAPNATGARAVTVAMHVEVDGSELPTRATFDESHSASAPSL